MNDSVLDVFERRVREANLTEDQILFFPKYGECPQPVTLLGDARPPLTTAWAPRFLRDCGPITHPER